MGFGLARGNLTNLLNVAEVLLSKPQFPVRMLREVLSLWKFRPELELSALGDENFKGSVVELTLASCKVD